MPLVLDLGPLAFSADRLLAVAAVIAILAIGSRERWFGKGAERKVWLALVAGLVCARAGFVVHHHAVFADEPAGILAFWDGGFELPVGIATATVTGLIVSRGRARFFLPSLILAASGLTVGLETMARHTPPAIPAAPIENLDGSSTAVLSGDGKPKVINLWASWCAPCRREMPLLENAAAAETGIDFLFINTGEDQATVAEFVREASMDPRWIFRDPAGQWAATYGGALPTTIFLDRNGKVVSVHSGEISRPALAVKISEAMRL